MNLDDLNLKLCDYELVMDAFAGFRTRQLQTNRTLFLELSGGKESCDEAPVEGATHHRFLEDLHVVSFYTLQKWRFICRARNNSSS